MFSMLIVGVIPGQHGLFGSRFVVTQHIEIRVPLRRHVADAGLSLGSPYIDQRSRKLVTGLVLRVVAASGGWIPRWSEKHSHSYALSEAQVPAFGIEPAPGQASH